MTISYNTLLLFVNPHAIPVDIGITVKPVPVRDSVAELDVVAIRTNVSNHFKIVDSVLYFLYFFLDL